MLEVLASLALLISSLSSAVWLLHQNKQTAEEQHFRVRVFALSCFFVSSYALCQLFLKDTNEHTNALLQMSENLTIYISLPFIATIFVAIGKGWHWSMAGWGRWLLGLIAFFELTRRTDYGVSYSYTLSILVIAALLISSFVAQPKSARILLIAGTLSIAFSTLLFSPIPLLMDTGNTPLFMLFLAISLPLLMTSLHERIQDKGRSLTNE